MGRPQDSKQLKQLRGTDRDDRPSRNHIEYDKLSSVPDPPAHLNATPTGIKLWNFLANELIRAKLMASVDVIGLDLLVTATIDYWEACEKLVGVPKVTIVKGKPVVNPYIKIRLKAIDTMNKMIAHFGFTPMTRQKLFETDGTPKKSKNSDPMAALLFGAQDAETN